MYKARYDCDGVLARRAFLGGMVLVDGEIEALLGGMSAFALLRLASMVEAVVVPPALSHWVAQTQRAEMRRRSGFIAPLPSLAALSAADARQSLRGIDEVMLHARNDGRLTLIERDRLLSLLRALRGAL